jgi:hypothetical protein
MLLDNKTTVFIRCKKPTREKKSVAGATFSRPLAAECRPCVIHAIALATEVTFVTAIAKIVIASRAKFPAF